MPPMIPLTDMTLQTLSWQDLVKNAISDIRDLMDILGLPAQSHYSDFPLLVPAPFLSRIEKGNPSDPLLLQILSSHFETESVIGYTDHPLNEADYTPGTGLIRKYQGRVLIIVSGACAINCRFCFRRNFPYQDFQPDTQEWQQLIKYLSDDSTITEVILSGGDPLMLPDNRLKWLIGKVEEITHVKTLRIHSRMPVAIPQRISDQLLNILNSRKLKVVLVNHINHANEIDDQVIDAMNKLNNSGTTLLNQSVLLKRVNDSVDDLTHLSQRLFDANILPYYLHLLDPVSGSAHFNVDRQTAINLVDGLRAQLPGYLVPKLVQEIPGGQSKIPII